jgi:hypothetical protein
MVENITFTAWILTDRCELVTTVQLTEKFITSLLEKLLPLFCHLFIARHQVVFFKDLKCNLQKDEFC